MSSQEVTFNCSREDARAYRLSRKTNDGNFSLYPGIITVNPDSASHTHKNLWETEETLVPSRDYVRGSAAHDNHILPISGGDRVLITAEHATQQIRTRADGSKFEKEEDEGTGALAYVVATQTKSSALIAIGRQTGDPNNDAEHTFKEEIEKITALPVNEAFLSVHGISRAIASDAQSPIGYSVFLGYGDTPSDASRTLAHDYLEPAAKDMGLTIGTNQRFISFNAETNYPLRKIVDKSLVTRVFKASGNTSRAYAESVARNHGKEDYVALQIELSAVLRCLQDESIWSTQEDRELGAWLGYQFLKTAVESVEKLRHP